MAKRKGGKRAAKLHGDRETSEGRTARVRSLVFRPRTLVVMAALISVGVCLPFMLRRVPDLRRRDEYFVAARGIEISPSPPAWIPSTFVEDVLAGAERLSVLDSGVNETIARAFAKHPWVERVVRVEKMFPARVLVELDFRKPVAMVVVKQGLYPVDAGGTLLPPGDFEPSHARQYPLIRGVLSTPHGPAGTPWGDVAVVGAANLAETLAEHWSDLELQSILVPKIEQADVDADSLIYELQTPGGTRIVWGRAPGTAHPGELATEQKVGRLLSYRTDFGGFDQPHGPYEIDIRHWQEISRRPLASGRQREPL